MGSELRAEIEELRSDFETLRESLKIEEKSVSLHKLEQAMQKANFWEQPERAQETVKELKELKGDIQPFREVDNKLSDLEILLDLAEEEEDEATLEEVGRDAETLRARLEKLQLRMLLRGENDHRNAYLSVHAGAGGTESCDWAEMLLRMYKRWIERRGFQLSLIDINPGEEAGIKNAILHVRGSFAYGYLRNELGVHRLVRISPFDFNQRRHTSFAAVDVLPDLGDAIPIEVKENDLRIDTFRSGGAGGQHVNKTDSAVRITHIPTGITVVCQNERSQHSNRRTAMSLLKAKLYRLEEQKREEELSRLYSEKGEIAWGNQIRSYVLHPYNLVKDHRTSTETSNTQAVLDGDIDDFIEAHLKWKASRSS
jgi:peptide chain release factor 2